MNQLTCKLIGSWQKKEPDVGDLRHKEELEPIEIITGQPCSLIGIYLINLAVI
jgi:hypothetical protein